MNNVKSKKRINDLKLCKNVHNVSKVYLPVRKMKKEMEMPSVCILWVQKGKFL